MNKETPKDLQAFSQEVISSLIKGQRYQIIGFGTFSTCSRKATKDRAACKIAMFRASKELREYFSGGPIPVLSGIHETAICFIIQAMQSEQGIEIPQLGRFAVEQVTNKSPKIIFHGAKELNNLLIVK
jgi:nucleoid DNA-binding protein